VGYNKSNKKKIPQREVVRYNKYKKKKRKPKREAHGMAENLKKVGYI